MRRLPKLVVHLSLFIPFSIFINPCAGAELADCSLVPGWSQEGAARQYASDNLFEYMDGNAEAYLLYGFQQMQGVTCKSGDNTIIIDVSEMNDADAAYGIFSANRDPARPIEKIGMGGQIMSRRGVFAKGSDYIELAANPDRDHTPALRAFVTAMEQRITGQSTPPEALSWFVPDKLASVRLIPESVLGIRLLKRGYVAQYDQGKAFLVLEQSPESAAAVMSKLRQRFPDSHPAQVADEAIQVQDKYLASVCFFRKGKYLGGSANMPDGASALTQAAILAGRVP